MSRSFDPDDPRARAADPARDLDDPRAHDYAARPSAGAPIRTTILNTDPDAAAAAVHDADDYIEAEYVPGEHEPHATKLAAHTEHAEHSAHANHSSVRDTLTRIPDALGAIGRTLERAISAKDEYVVAVKITTEAQSKLEQLVQAGVFRSRAEAAAYLIDEGIAAQAALFSRVDQKLSEIERLRAELRGLIHEDDASQNA